MRKLAFDITVTNHVPGAVTWTKIKEKLINLKFDQPASYMEIWRLFSEESGAFQLEGLNRPTESFNMYLDNVRVLQNALDLYQKHSRPIPDLDNPIEEMRRMSRVVERARTPTTLENTTPPTDLNQSIHELESEMAGDDQAW